MYYRVMREIHSKIDWAKTCNYTLFVTPANGIFRYETEYDVNRVNIDPLRGVFTPLGPQIGGLDPQIQDPGPRIRIRTPDPRSEIPKWQNAKIPKCQNWKLEIGNCKIGNCKIGNCKMQKCKNVKT